jgi:hypothetical protein
MKDINVKSYYLSFACFSIEIRIDKQSSVDFTNRFNQHGPGFVFAVAEIWLKHEESTHLIVPATHPENFLERLRDWRAIVSVPPLVSGIETVHPCGGWGLWMAGYWDRVDKESGAADDEKLYELLNPLSIIDSRVGDIAVYMYGGKKIFEVTVRPGEGRTAVGTWAQFNSEVLSNEVEDLAKVIAANIRSDLASTNVSVS